MATTIGLLANEKSKKDAVRDLNQGMTLPDPALARKDHMGPS